MLRSSRSSNRSRDGAGDVDAPNALEDQINNPHAQLNASGGGDNAVENAQQTPTAPASAPPTTTQFEPRQNLQQPTDARTLGRPNC